MTAKTGDTFGGRGTGLWSGRCVAGSAVCVSIHYENGNSLQTSIRLLHLCRRDPSPASSALHLSRLSTIEHYKHVKKTSPSMERGAKWGHVPGCPCPHAPHAHSFRHMDQARLRGALCAPNPPLTRQRATLPTEIQTKSARERTLKVTRWRNCTGVISAAHLTPTCAETRSTPAYLCGLSSAGSLPCLSTCGQKERELT